MKMYYYARLQMIQIFQCQAVSSFVTLVHTTKTETQIPLRNISLPYNTMRIANNLITIFSMNTANKVS